MIARVPSPVHTGAPQFALAMGMFLDGCFECDVATTIQISIDYGMHKSDEFSPCLCWVLAMLQSLGFPYMAGECIAASSSPHGDHVDGERKRTPLPSAIGRAARSRSCGCAGLVHLARQSVSNRCNHRRAHRSDRYNHQSSGREEVVISKEAQRGDGPRGDCPDFARPQRRGARAAARQAIAARPAFQSGAGVLASPVRCQPR
jgi:hypothetical protein